ncbi:MAG: uncharacterized protein JWO60_978 [Frankiales bacterium]|nr:uncharacterized protein [Frankiales bacterium]
MLPSAAWLHALDLRRAHTVVEVPGGAAVLSPSFPAAHDHGKLSMAEDVDGALLAAAADDVLGGAGLSHRLVELRVPDAPRARAGLLAAGYTCAEVVLMEWEGGALLPAGPEVVELTLPQRTATASADWRRQLPDDGRVVARADLYEHDGRAQVEEVVTEPASRGRGFASLLVRDAVRRAGGRPVLLVADADDWPRELYARLGFRAVAVLASFSR